MSRRYDLIFGAIILLLGVGILIRSTQGTGGTLYVVIGIVVTATGLLRLAQWAGLLRRPR